MAGRLPFWRAQWLGVTVCSDQATSAALSVGHVAAGSATPSRSRLSRAAHAERVGRRLSGQPRLGPHVHRPVSRAQLAGQRVPVRVLAQVHGGAGESVTRAGAGVAASVRARPVIGAAATSPAQYDSRAAISAPGSVAQSYVARITAAKGEPRHRAAPRPGRGCGCKTCQDHEVCHPPGYSPVRSLIGGDSPLWGGERIRGVLRSWHGTRGSALQVGRYSPCTPTSVTKDLPVRSRSRQFRWSYHTWPLPVGLHRTRRCSRVMLRTAST